ncbi:glycosyltransferase [uncultured Brachybacterium sp.]|uniref:glycosyltransferase n=1 Tax=uncultured Brachybacterium sp. TaxID=189680 RepID=UPI002606F890|nr:glycosyltransferase [uncultured Brachybacterium sp.]
MPSTRRVALNARLLLQSAVQHAMDDPALLVVQVSRRLPFATRVRAGKWLRTIAATLPGLAGASALGAFMAGETADAQRRLAADPHSRSTLHGEVSVLLDRPELLSDQAPAATRARSAWSRGEMSEAVGILEAAGQGSSAYARRLRSELDLLQPGHRLAIPEGHVALSPGRTEGEGLRVLHLITNSLPHTQSGYSLRTHRILRTLADSGVRSVALTRTGYPVMIGKVLARDSDGIDGVEYRRTLPASLGATPQRRLEQEVVAALNIVRELRPHVLHATTDYRNAMVAQAVSEATGIPWVLEVRGLMEQTWIAARHTEQARAAAEASEKVRLVRAREGELAAAASAVVTLSATMAEQLIERGVDPARITLVPNGVDESLLTDHLAVAEARRRVGLDLPDEAFAVGAVSALVDYEGFETVLRAVGQLLHSPETDRELRERLHVVLVGDGVAAPGLAELARELGIRDRVHLPGRVPAAEARRWVESLDVVTVPRLDRAVSRSVTPQKPVEALALGRPVILSDLPALRETVTGPDGALHATLIKAGSAEQLAEEIAGLAADGELRVRHSVEGQRMARERTWSALVRRYEQVYTNVSHQKAEENRSGE